MWGIDLKDSARASMKAPWSWVQPFLVIYLFHPVLLLHPPLNQLHSQCKESQSWGLLSPDINFLTLNEIAAIINCFQRSAESADMYLMLVADTSPQLTAIWVAWLKRWLDKKGTLHFLDVVCCVFTFTLYVICTLYVTNKHEWTLQVVTMKVWDWDTMNTINCLEYLLLDFPFLHVPLCNPSKSSSYPIPLSNHETAVGSCRSNVSSLLRGRYLSTRGRPVYGLF